MGDERNVLCSHWTLHIPQILIMIRNGLGLRENHNITLNGYTCTLGFNIRIRIYPDNPVIRYKLFVPGYFSSEFLKTIRIYPSNSYKS